MLSLAAVLALALALAVPAVPPGRVADYAQLLTPSAASRNEARLAEHESRTGTQMVVAIFRSLEGEDLEDYSIRLAQQWRIGRKGLDDGVILLVFVDERRVRLEVGHGLAPVVPDAAAGRIIRDAIAPAFRERRYAEGIELAVEAVYARIGGEARPAPVAPGPAPRVPLVALLLVGAVVVIVLMSMAAPGPRARRRGYTAGRNGWYIPPTGIPPGWGGGRRGGFGGGGFSGGGGSFGGGGASGSW
jgi:uncharacterized protein